MDCFCSNGYQCKNCKNNIIDIVKGINEPDDRFNKITILCINQNNIGIIKNLPNNLNSLECDRCNLTELPKFPKSVTEIFCPDNNLTELPDLRYLSNLKILTCFCNNIKEITNLPDSLEYLDCSSNELESFPQITENMKKIEISGNNVKSLLRDLARRNNTSGLKIVI